MQNNTLFNELDTELKNLLVKLKEAEKNSESCMAKNDYNTAAYWDQVYKDAWNEYTRIAIEINKIPGVEV